MQIFFSPSTSTHFVVTLCLCAMFTALGARRSTATTTPLQAVEDVVIPAAPGATRLGGLLGDRHQANLRGRLLTISEQDMLGGFEKRPGSHPWIGEHVGKWLHAGSLAWLNTGDPRLRAKLDHVVQRLIATQEPSGYLGTYAPGRRMGMFEGDTWDVWVHKYAILGLLSYHDATGNMEALESAKRAGDHLINVFGSGERDLNQTSIHVGMASTSIIEPLILLYRRTGEDRYLKLAQRAVEAWDLPTGAGVISRLLKDKTVLTVGNRKAYEMLSCLVGACELHRSTGQPELLQASSLAWEDIVRNHLYITGSSSVDERFTPDRHLPCRPEDKIGEVCVTVAWIQLNLQLFRLTGESRYMDEIERSVYNHLLGAQRPSGTEISYYTPLEGRKPYEPVMTCCFSSMTRGVALLPTFAYTASRQPDQPEAVQVNLYGESESRLRLPSGREVHLYQRSAYPTEGSVRLEVDPVEGNHFFRLQLRAPKWAERVRWRLAGAENWSTAAGGNWIELERDWKAGDAVELEFPMTARLVAGDQVTSGQAAVTWGPLVLSADRSDNPGMAGGFESICLPKPGSTELVCRPVVQGSTPRFEVEAADADAASTATRRLVLTPFYAAGRTGGEIQTWFKSR